jgi:hypothetical protein
LGTVYEPPIPYMVKYSWKEFLVCEYLIKSGATSESRSTFCIDSSTETISYTITKLIIPHFPIIN